MLFKGRIETTSFPKILDLQVAFGLDTALAPKGRCQCTAGRFATACSNTGYLLNQTVR